MKQFLTLGSVALLLAGCAVPAAKKASNLDFMKAGATVSASAEQIRNDLKRSGVIRASQLATQEAYVEAWPYTDALVKAEVTEDAQKNMDSEETKNKNLSERRKAFIDSGTCFLIGLRTLEIDHAQYKNWRAKLEVAGKMTELKFNVYPWVNAVPAIDHMGIFTWLNTAVACAPMKIDLTKTFTLHVLPQFSKSPHASMTWDAPQAKAK